MVSASLEFSTNPNADPVATDVREGLLADPGFGRVFTDHMVTIRYTEGQGWHDAVLGPRQPRKYESRPGIALCDVPVPTYASSSG